MRQKKREKKEAISIKMARGWGDGPYQYSVP